MSESFTSMSRSSVISASTAEHEVKRNLKLVRECLRAISTSRKLNTNKPSRLESRRSTSSLQRRDLINIAGGNKRGTLSQIGGNERGRDRILCKRRSSLLERRAIRTNLIEIRSSITRSANTIAVPSSHLADTLSLVSRNLPKGHHLQPYCGNPNLVKQAGNMRILRRGSKNFPHTQVHRAGGALVRDNELFRSAVFQAKAGKITLL